MYCRCVPLCYNIISVCSTPASCAEYAVRLSVGDFLEDDYYRGQTSYDDYYYIKDSLARGRVEVCIEGNFSPVCMDGWSHADASVVCRELGFSQNGS